MKLSLPIGVYEKALPVDISWEERFSVAKQSEFDYIELSVDESDERQARLESNSVERKEIRAALMNSDISLKTMCLSGHRKYALGSSDAATRAKSIEVFDKAIDLACELGIRIIQVAGYYVYYEDETEDSIRWYEEGLAKGLELAQKSGMMLAIENMDTLGITSLEEGMRIVKLFNSPWLQLYPDIGNLTERGKDTLKELELAKNHMVALHIKDTRPGEPRRVAFGEGDVPFTEAFKKLAELNFTGPIMVEMWNDNAPDSLQKVQDARSWVVSKLIEGGLVKEVTT